MTFLDIALIVLGAYAVMLAGMVILTRCATPDPQERDGDSASTRSGTSTN